MTDIEKKIKERLRKYKDRLLRWRTDLTGKLNHPSHEEFSSDILSLFDRLAEDNGHTIEVECPECNHSDVWRCAVGQGLTELSCHCPCHKNKGKTTRPATAIEVLERIGK